MAKAKSDSALEKQLVKTEAKLEEAYAAIRKHNATNMARKIDIDSLSQEAE